MPAIARFTNLDFAALEQIPLAAWVILLAMAVFIGEYILLRGRQRHHVGRAAEAERRLTRFATALRNFARDNLQRLPASLEELNLPESEGVIYRPASRLNLDEKLILLHDRGPTHKILEFPALRDGRGVVFASGRMVVVSEEAFEKLIAADDALRERLGLVHGGAPSTEDTQNGTT